MSEAKKQNFLHGAAILAAGVFVIKILGAIYKIPLRNIIGETGYGYFFAAYTIYNFFPFSLSGHYGDFLKKRSHTRIREFFTLTLQASLGYVRNQDYHEPLYAAV